MTPAHIGYLLHPSPLGEVLIVTTDEGVVTLHPLRERLDDELERLAHRLDSIPERTDDDPVAAAAGRQLDEYFAGDRRDFDIDLDWRLVRGFTRAALEAVREIPYGETAAYGEVAAHAGSPRASRAVGTACATTPFSLVVPVHRVVRADGSLGEYGGHPEDKRFLLDLERAASGADPDQIAVDQNLERVAGAAGTERTAGASDREHTSGAEELERAAGV